MYKNSLIRKRRLFSKFMTSQPITHITDTHIAQYLKKQKQSDNKICSLNRI